MEQNIIRADQLTSQGHYVTSILSPYGRQNYWKPARVVSHYHPTQTPGLTVFTLDNGDTHKVPNSAPITLE